MRLVHLLNYRPLGTRAMDHFIEEYARQGRQRGWAVTFGFTAEPPPDFAEQLQAQAAEWFVFKAPFSWATAEAVRDQLGGGEPPVLVTSFLSAFEKPLLWLKRRGVVRRLVVIDHSSGTGPRSGGALGLLRRLRGAIVGRIVDRVVCVSEFIARRDRERVYLPAEIVRVVPNGIDLARFPLGTLDPRPRRVAFAGQLIPEKGVDVLIEAMRLLADASVECVIAGEGAERERLEQNAPAGVRFAGRVADVAELFREAAVVVVPSVWAEAFGLVAIEAMASGAAVIASDAGALPEVVGDAGVIVPRGNAAALAEAIRGLLADEAGRRRLAVRGRERVETHFQLSDCVQRHLDVIDSWK